MTIATYAELQSTLVTLSHRTDLATIMPTLIGLAENEIFRELTLRGIETSVSGTISGATIALPADMDTPSRIKIASGGAEYTINYASPNGNDRFSTGTDLPSRFTIEEGAIHLIPAPNGPYAYTLYYVPLLTALSASNTTNWLLTNHPDVYTKGGLVEIHRHTRNTEQLALAEPRLATALDSVKRSDERKRFPQSGGLQIKPRGVR